MRCFKRNLRQRVFHRAFLGALSSFGQVRFRWGLPAGRWLNSFHNLANRWAPLTLPRWFSKPLWAPGVDISNLCWLATQHRRRSCISLILAVKSSRKSQFASPMPLSYLLSISSQRRTFAPICLASNSKDARLSSTSPSAAATCRLLVGKPCTSRTHWCLPKTAKGFS